MEADQPRIPDGSIPGRRVSRNGSLASPHVLAHEHALPRDLIRSHPSPDGLRIDWPECPPHLLDSAFLDFSCSAERAAERLGFPFQRMRRDVGLLCDKLHGGLTDADLAAWARGADGGRFGLLRLMSDHPGVSAGLRFEAALVEATMGGLGRVMNESGGGAMELLPNAFPPPWTIVSGMDFRGVARHSTAIGRKLHTMHWPMMLRFHGDQPLEASPGLSSGPVAQALVTPSWPWSRKLESEAPGEGGARAGSPATGRCATVGNRNRRRWPIQRCSSIRCARR